MIDLARRPIAADVEDAIRSLVTAEHFSAGSIVSMPVVYPSGASVVLEATRQGGRFFVTDRGGACQEAEFVGASRYFVREAARLAEESGIKFDGRDMFIIEVEVGQLAGALAVVANCSATVANICAMKAANRAEKEADERLYERLSRVFETSQIEAKAYLLGASSHSWRVSALVTTPRGRSAFEAVTNHYTSIVGAAAKFHDLARLDDPPKRIAVITSREALGDYIGVISPAVSSIIEFRASNDAYERAIAA